MKRIKIAARIMAFTLTASLGVSGAASVFAASASENVLEGFSDERISYIEETEVDGTIEPEIGPEIKTEPETEITSDIEPGTEPEIEGGTEPEIGSETSIGTGTEAKLGAREGTLDGLIYVDDALYSGYYMDSQGIFYIVTEGAAAPVNGAVSNKTEYYRCDNTGALTIMSLSQQTVFVEGKVYTGHYTDASGKMYVVTDGIQKLKNGAMGKGSRYYSCDAGKILTLSKQTLYVDGKVYTGYYLDNASKMYNVKNGTRALQTGAVKKGSRYYNCKSQKIRTLGKETLYVKGKVYTGHYLAPSNKMYSVKNGICALKTGTMKKGIKYYVHKSEKTKKLSKETLYVKGKVFTGHYQARSNKMYRVKKGTKALENGVLNKNAKYYSQKSKKTKALKKKTIYVNGKAMKGMSPASMLTLQRAQAVVARVTNDRMTKKEKLKACFDFVKTYRECSPRPHYRGMDWPVIYANDMFVRGIGNCCSYGAAFAYMAKAIGYEQVYCCNSGGHGWAEIDGLVYDPEWSIHHHGHSYYALSYNARTDQNYKGAIGAGLPWMHVKI